jgi:hypothetical protein
MSEPLDLVKLTEVARTWPQLSVWRYPDFISDREGIDRWRASSRVNDGHALVANNNTVFRLVQTIDSLMGAILALSTVVPPVGEKP